MSGLAKLNDKMKKKLSLGDYTIASPPYHGSVTQHLPSDERQEPRRKIYALSKEDVEKLRQIFKNRLANGQLSSLSGIMSEAIQLLYTQSN